MPVSITSTTDSSENITAALGSLNPKEPAKEVAKPAPEETSDEKTSASEALDEIENETETDADEDDQETGAEKGKSKKQGGFKRRIGKLNARISAKEHEVEYWKSQALKVSDAGAKGSPAREVTVQVSGKPKSDDFDTHEAYIEALTDWKYEQKEKDRDVKTKQTQAKDEYEKKISAHQERALSFKDSHDDFDEVMADVDDINISTAMQELIVGAENGPELMYELAKNKEELKRISELTPLAAALEMGKFAAKMMKATEKELPKVTKTPPPVKPVGSNTKAGKKSLDDPNLSQREWEKLREEQLRARRA